MKYGYARVSTIDQSLNLQLDALKQAGCKQVFSDHGVSGNIADRSGLNQLLQAMQNGDLLVVWKLDRLGRSLGMLCQLMEHLSARDIGFKSLTDGIDTTTSSGKLIFHIMGALAEFERTLISERTKEGMRAAKKRGVHIGRPRLLSCEDLRRIHALSRSGHTQVQLAKYFSVSINTVARSLKATHSV